MFEPITRTTREMIRFALENSQEMEGKWVGDGDMFAICLHNNGTVEMVRGIHKPNETGERVHVPFYNPHIDPETPYYFWAECSENPKCPELMRILTAQEVRALVIDAEE
mgnify:CR=1 FL=1